MKVLLAEDEPVILAALKLRLKKEGYEIITAEDGQDAIQKIADHSPDVIVTDMMMPFNSGIEVLSAAKRLNKNTKVIVLSGMGQESIVIEAFQLGADDYMVKPFSPDELALRINRLIAVEAY